MNTRIKELRTYLHLTQKEFGDKIGFKPSSINDIEHARCNVSDRIIIAICAKYNVNEEWLRYGHGEMFIKYDEKFEEFFKIFSKLNKPLQDFLIQCAKNLIDAQNKL